MSPDQTTASNSRYGAYGMALSSGVFPEIRLNALSSSAAPWTVLRREIDPESDPHGDAPIGDEPVLGESEVDDRAAQAQVAGTRLEIDRDARTATIRARVDVSPERLVHPVLAPIGIAVAHWSGHVPLHASAVIVEGRAWAILADRGDGKTTTVAALERAGHGVVTDDLLIVDRELQAHAGPRCVDLRASSVELFPEAERVDDYPTRERYRLTPGPVPATVPLAGFVRLLWSEHRSELSPIRPADRLGLLGASISMGGPLANPALVLELAALPAFALERRKGLDSLDFSVEAVASLRA